MSVNFLSAVISDLEPKEIKSVTVLTFSPLVMK